MDKKRAITNITVGIIFKIILLILAVVSKSFVVRYLGDEANGLYSLYTSIIGFLAVANLGIGTAITFNMYKPIVENDHDTVSALYYLYKKFYLIIFFVIMGVGLALTPFVPMLAKDNTGNINIHITYIIFLISVTITYLFAHKTSLINAYKDNYITTLITSITTIFEGILQILVIIVTKSFIYFLLIRIISSTLNGLITNYIYNKKYKKHINGNKFITEDVKGEVYKYAKGMMFYRLGTTLMTSFDGIIISAFVGVVSLSYYSNYIVIVAGLTTLLNLIFSEITSIVGQLYVKQSKTTYFNQFKKAYAINFIIGVIFYLGFIAISDSLVSIIFGSDKIIERSIVLIIGINHFIQFMRRSITLFKTASGGFYNDRYRPFVEGIVNIILSIIFVNLVGTIGVLIATIISKLIVTYSYEPYVLFNVSFERSSKKFHLIHYFIPVIFVSIVFVFISIPIPTFNSRIITLLVQGFLSVVVSLISLLIIYILFKPFRKIVNDIIKNGIDSIKNILKTRNNNND